MLMMVIFDDRDGDDKDGDDDRVVRDGDRKRLQIW